MVDLKTSDYTAITTSAGSDLLDIARPGVNNFKQTVSDFTAQISTSLFNFYEIVNKNLKSYPAALNYNGSGDITSVVYTVPGGTITKTFNYTSGDLTSIVLSGNTPAGINLTKTLNYTAGNLTGVSYS